MHKFSYLLMPARRHSGVFTRHYFYPLVVWRIGGPDPIYGTLYDLTRVKRRIDPISHKFIQKLSPLLTNYFYSFLKEVSSIICHNNSFYFYLNKYADIFDNRKKTI